MPRPPVVARLLAGVDADDVATHAAALTYATFLAIPPMLLLGLSVAGFVLAGDTDAQRALADDLVSMVPGLRDVLGDWVASVVEGRVTLGLVALPAVLWTSTGAFSRARHALAAVFGVPSVGIVTGRLRGLLVQVPLGLALVGLVTLNGLVAGLGRTDRIGPALEALAVAVLVVLGVGYCSLAYRLLAPDIPLGDHLPGAVLFSVAWGVLHRLGALLVPGRIDADTALYGAIGLAFGMLAFLYATMWTFLLCAEVSRLVRERRRPALQQPAR